MFEGTLILLGLLGAFALNEWQDARAREARSAVLVAAIRAELTVNLEWLDDASSYNTGLVVKFREAARNGATSVPDGSYPRGLFLRAQLTSAAWTAAQNENLLDNVPVETLLAIANAYEAQSQYVESTGHLHDIFYEKALRPTSADTPVGVQLLADVLNDYASRGRGLVELYRGTLTQLPEN